MNIEQHLREKKGDIFMKKKILTVMLAGVMAAGMSAGSVQAATTEDASGDLYVFIAASLANAMDEIQKDYIRMLIFFSMQTVQVHYRHRSKKVPDVISSFQQQPNRWMRW